ncbi:hypothetical protein BpHYR1_006051 [Brachionus plicatilis]|uniref:Uncharacterized protein n=1 Tax=Brachionus plicatilis TaxID=10195 RepID=A0A3M7PGH9_BRAPC|nr:hypothetical protein BpHYR1_006051 [Brachionus plicatilis]
MAFLISSVALVAPCSVKPDRGKYFDVVKFLSRRFTFFLFETVTAERGLPGFFEFEAYQSLWILLSILESSLNLSDVQFQFNFKSIKIKLILL